MRKLKNYLAIGLCFVSAAAIGDTSDCREYHVVPSHETLSPRITTICTTDAGVEITHRDVEEQGESQKQDEKNKAEISQNQGKDSDLETNAVAEDVTEDAAEDVTENVTEAVDANSAINETSNKLEKYRNGNNYEKVYYFFHRVFVGSFTRLVEKLKGQ